VPSHLKSKCWPTGSAITRLRVEVSCAISITLRNRYEFSIYELIAFIGATNVAACRWADSPHQLKVCRDQLFSWRPAMSGARAGQVEAGPKA
jgi:hypothetical protein